MPGTSGLDVLRCAKKANPETVVIIITGYASLETAISAVKEGAYDYIRKPFKLDEIKIAVEKAIDKIQGIRENQFLLKKLEEAYQELVAVKQEMAADRSLNRSTIHFFPSSMATVPYLYDAATTQHDYVAKIEALSSLKEGGLLSESEFKKFKSHLMKQLASDTPKDD
jgi:YesN/AraC family two-component response regulator